MDDENQVMHVFPSYFTASRDKTSQEKAIKEKAHTTQYKLVIHILDLRQTA